MSQQIGSLLVETQALVAEPYASILGYPRCSQDELENRLRELKTIGVEAILLEGPTLIGKLRVLGKGCVSVVVKTIVEGKERVLKIRRIDADRASMAREGEYLKLANSVGVGPTFIRSSKSCLVMEFANGRSISAYIATERSRKRLANVISAVLEQCFQLDRIRLDHGELSDMRKHAIVGDGVTIIDFESASVNRRVSNVTAATQYLFIGGAYAKKMRAVFRINAVEQIISTLRNYKNNISNESFGELKKELGI